MNKKTLRLSIAIIAVLNVTFVAGQALDEAFDAIANIGLVGSFQSYPQIWDGIFLIWIFIVLGREILSKPLDSKPAGGAIGAVLGLMAFGGLQFMEYSITRDFGPWIITIAVIALIIFIIRMFQTGEDKKNIGAVGVFVITTFLTQHGPTKDMILEFNSLIFGIITLVWILSIVFTLVWALGKLTGGVSPEGRGTLGKSADFVNRNRKEGRDLRDSLRRNRPTPAQNATQLQNSVTQLDTRVSQFGTLVDQFRTALGGCADFSETIRNMRPLQRRQMYNRINTILPSLQQQITDINADYGSIIASQAVNSFNNAQRTNHNQKVNTIMNQYHTYQTNILTMLR